MNSENEVPQGVGAPVKLLYSKQEAARMLSVSIRTLENLFLAGQLTFRKVGRRTLIPHDSLVSFTRRNHSTTKAQAQ